MINEIDYRKGDESNVSKNKFQENNIRFSCEILVIIISSSDDDKISSPVFAVYGIINECALFFRIY